MHWVTQYHAFCNNSKLNKSESDTIKKYLHHLKKNHESWQISQVKEAVRFYNYYKNIDKKKEIPNNDSLSSSREWKKIEDETVKELRLRHRDFRTEKSYIGWVRRMMIAQGFLTLGCK